MLGFLIIRSFGPKQRDHVCSVGRHIILERTPNDCKPAVRSTRGLNDAATGFFQSKNDSDICVIQGLQQLRLVLRPGDPLRVVGEFFRQDVNSNISVQLGIVRPVDPPHAGANRSRDHITTKSSSDQQSR